MITKIQTNTQTYNRQIQSKCLKNPHPLSFKGESQIFVAGFKDFDLINKAAAILQKDAGIITLDPRHTAGYILRFSDKPGMNIAERIREMNEFFKKNGSDLKAYNYLPEEFYEAEPIRLSTKNWLDRLDEQISDIFYAFSDLFGAILKRK